MIVVPERTSDLAVALACIPFVAEPFFDGFVAPAWERRERTPLYVLPIERRDQETMGFFLVNGSWREARLGFLTEHEGKQAYCHVTREGLKEGSKRQHTLYLPVNDTLFRDVIGNDTVRGWRREHGSPFTICGVDGAVAIHPLCLFETHKDSPKAQCLYRKRSGKINLYDLTNEETAKVREHVKTMSRLHRQHSFDLLHPLRGYPRVLGLQQEPVPECSPDEVDWTQPPSIVRYLDDYIIGQEDGRKNIAIAIAAVKRAMDSKRPVQPRMHTLIAGPTGTGKTETARLLASKANIPFIEFSLAGKVPDGYKGAPVSDVFSLVRERTSGAEPYCIVFLDEVDKLGNSYWSDEGDFSEQLQDMMLSWLDGTKIIGTRTVDTRNMLFICAGAFSGGRHGQTLEAIARSRRTTKRSIGFGSDLAVIDEHDAITARDFITYGYKPEFIARFPVIARYHVLTREQKTRILRNTKKSVFADYITDLTTQGYAVEIEDDVYGAMVEACPEETGARALGEVCFRALKEILYDPKRFADERKVIVLTEKVIAEQLTG